jgi:hypothetical protein
MSRSGGATRSSRGSRSNGEISYCKQGRRGHETGQGRPDLGASCRFPWAGARFPGQPVPGKRQRHARRACSGAEDALYEARLVHPCHLWLDNRLLRVKCCSVAPGTPCPPRCRVGPRRARRPCRRWPCWDFGGVRPSASGDRDTCHATVLLTTVASAKQLTPEESNRRIALPPCRRNGPLSDHLAEPGRRLSHGPRHRQHPSRCVAPLCTFRGRE